MVWLNLYSKISDGYIFEDELFITGHKFWCQLSLNWPALCVYFKWKRGVIRSTFIYTH